MNRSVGVAMTALGFAMMLISLGGERVEAGTMKKTAFGKTAAGKGADLYVLTNKNGVEVAITNYGATVVSIKVPDRNGKVDDVALGYDTVAGYETDKSFLGCTVGRYANRIALGKFTLDGKTYTLAKNNGENHLHGGVKGFNRYVWRAKDVSTKDVPAVRMSYVSADGEEGYPGKLSVDVTFSLTDQNELKIDYSGTTDKPTVVNLTNHSYFNLAGHASGDVLGQELMIAAEKFTPIDAGAIPLAANRPVEGTPFDFRQSTAIGARIGHDDEQLKVGKGYDHNFVLATTMRTKPELAARAYDPKSGRVMEVWTTEPGVQLYTANYMDGTAKGKGGAVYNYRNAFCLETEHWPDSPNRPDFPSTVLRPKEQYRTTTIYKFSTK
jgi:aldose 1-epimerase